MQQRRKSAAGHATGGRRLFQIISEQNAPSPLPYQDHLFDALMMETLNGSFSVDSSPEPGSFSEGARREDSNGDMGSPLEELAVLDWREVARAQHTR